MKNKLQKRYNSIIVLSMVSMLSVLLPGYIVLANGTIGSVGHAGGKGSATGKKWSIPASSTNRYAEPSENQLNLPMNGSGMSYSISSGGKTVTYKLFESQRDVESATARGLCDANPCATGSSMGFLGDRSTWTLQLKDAGNAAGVNGVSFDFSSPVGLAYAKEGLRLQGYDVDKMSQADIESTATQIALRDGKFVSTVATYTSVVKNLSTGRSFTCPGDSECGKVKSDGFCITAIYDMEHDELNGSTDDRGTVTKIVDDDDDDDDGGEFKFELDVDSCTVTPPQYPYPPKKEVPKDSPAIGTCGGTAVDIKYETSSTCAGRIIMLTTTKVTAHLPSAPDVVYAGEGFNWGGVTSVKNVSTIVFDNGVWVHDMQTEQANLIAYEAGVACVDAAIKKLEDQYNEQMRECSSNAIKSCYDDCAKNYTCENPGPAGCPGPTCNCSDAPENACKGLTEAFQEALAELQRLKGVYEAQVGQAKGKIQELLACSDQAKSLVGASNTFDTVSITNQKMNLNKGYVQKINTIKGVAKNSGLELTAEDLKKYTDPETYLEVNTNFFVPYYVKNGTEGKLVGDIVGDISIPDYSCPITVANNVVCTDDCGGKTSDLDLIYRPISLTNPFPNVKNSKYRAMGSNWDEILADTYVENNRGVKNYEIYNLTPIYTITLTPSTIKEIRSYNKKNSLNDFDMNCSDGYKCLSTFLWEKFNKIIDTGSSCATSTGWDETCYIGGASE